MEPFRHIAFILFTFGLLTSISVMEMGAALLLVAVVIELARRYSRGERWNRPPLLIPLILFSALILLGIILGEATTAAKWYDANRLRFFLVYFVLFYYLTLSRPAMTRLIGFSAGVAILIGVYGFFQHLFPLDLVRPEGKKIILYAIEREKLGPLVLGTFNHHLTFSNVVLFYVSWFLAVGLYTRKHRWLIALGALLALDCFWTQSRALWFALPVVLLLLILPLGKKWAAAVVAGLGLLVVTAFSFDSGFRERALRTLSPQPGEYSLTERQRLWQLQWDMFKDSPVWGKGWNNNERECRAYFQKRFGQVQDDFCGHAHSLWLQILSTTGLLGIALFIWIWVSLFRWGYRALIAYPRGSLEWATVFGLLIGFVGFHLQGVTQWNFGDAEVIYNVIYFWALIAWLASTAPAPATRSPV